MDSFEEVARGVNQLRQAVEDMNKNLVDRQTVENIAAEMVERAMQLSQDGRRRSVGAPDMSGESAHQRRLQIAPDGKQRLIDITKNPAAEVGPAIGVSPQTVQAFQEASDNVALLAHFFPDVQATDYYRSEYLPARQALSTGATGAGEEWVPTILSGALIERVNLELRVADLFAVIDMPSNPFEITGLSVVRQRGAKGVENTADTGQTNVKKITAGTRKVRLLAAKFWAEILVSKELDEDAVIPILPTMTSEIVDYLSADIEDAIINGDTAGTMDTGWASDDPRLNFDGLRKQVASGAKVDGADAALTSAMLRKNRQNLGKYGAKPTDLAHIISMGNYIQLLSDPAMLTLEKFGPNAVILTGELGKVDGVPVILSEYVRSDLNASGVYDNVTKTRSLALTVNRRGFMRGTRREMTVQVLRELYAEDDMEAVIVSTRQAFQPRFPSSELVAAETYNLSIA